MKLRTLAIAICLVPLTAGAALAQKGGGQRTPAKKLDKVFARLDADKDGRISRKESQARPRLAKRFDRLDADHDGYVTRAELAQAIEQRRKKICGEA